MGIDGALRSPPLADLNRKAGMTDTGEGTGRAVKWLQCAIFVLLYVAVFSALGDGHTLWKLAILVLVLGIPFYLASAITAFFVTEWAKPLFSAFEAEE